MSWDEFGFYPESVALNDYGGGSYNPSDYSGFEWASPVSPSAWTGPQFSNETFSDFGGGASDPGTFIPYGAGAGGPAPSFADQIRAALGMGGGTGAGSGGAGAGAQPGAQTGANPWLAGALGAAGPLAGLLGSLASGGQGRTAMPKMGTAQVAQMNQANQAMQPGATGQLPLQQMQMSLLQALQSGQGLPPGYQQLIEQAFQPQMGDLYTQAAQMGQARGFHDAPATSPPGGAILGPGLSNLQGQMAQAKLGLMQSLPQTFNQPIATQIGAANQQGAGLLNAARLGTGETSSQPIGSLIGQGLGSAISGAAQGYGAQQTQQAQQNTNSILADLMRRSSTNTSLSGAT